MISIIIPTKNEEHYLPKLLKSIKKQDYKDYEVIVSDAGSKDKTVSIAKKFKCKIVKGGLPSVGRNNGAKAAKGDLFLFLDSDVRLPSNFLNVLAENVEKRGLDAGSFYSKPYDGKWIDHMIVASTNLLMNLVKGWWAHAYGWCTFCKKKVYKKINGFDEAILLGEDNDFARRSSKAGKFGIIKETRVFNSMRRFEKEGRLNMSLRYTVHEMYRLFIGEIKGDKFKYNFDYKK
ncbi:MAG: glycosyltransferase [Nanoarchaeota archaeon]|nr:glycosyltransferase [Nanoarchaeota archaeon]MBU1005518.1 glycosyltransferase [Nanoarchaeota archaeon]MBU1945857.1 glycosyltransferase [Nanoarchaeota archaeon]